MIIVLVKAKKSGKRGGTLFYSLSIKRQSLPFLRNFSQELGSDGRYDLLENQTVAKDWKNNITPPAITEATTLRTKIKTYFRIFDGLEFSISILGYNL